MVHTLTVVTLRLAEAIGLYWLVAGVGLLVVPQRMGAILGDIERSPGLAYAFGVAAFAIATAILIPHHLLYDPLSVIVTLLAALLAVEGLVLIAAPQLLIAFSRPFMAASRLWAIVAIVLGALLLLAGLTGRANALP